MQAAIDAKDFDLAQHHVNKMGKWMETEYPKYYDRDPMKFPDGAETVLMLGRLAQAEGRKLDALAYYHQFITNPVYTREYAGPLKTAHTLFTELGEAREAWAVWSKPKPWPAANLKRRAVWAGCDGMR